MSSEKIERRKYVSTRRDQQAAETRRAVLDAAARLFAKSGWTGTTITAIAKEAGVSKETIYAVWGTKIAILTELVQAAIRGADPNTPLLEQAGPAAVARAATAANKIERFASDIAVVLSRVAPLVDVVRSSAGSDPESAALYDQLHAGRRRNLAGVAQLLAPDLRRGLRVEQATEEVWRLASPELYLLITRVGGLDLDGYVRWLAETLKRSLLAEKA